MHACRQVQPQPQEAVIPNSSQNCLTCPVRGPHCFCSLTAATLVELQAIGAHVRYAAGMLSIRSDPKPKVGEKRDRIHHTVSLVIAPADAPKSR